jgi:hypothetical protein
MDTYNDHGNAHQSQQPTTFFVVLPRHFDCSTRKPIQVLRRSCFLSLFAVGFGFLAFFETFRQLPRVALKSYPKYTSAAAQLTTPFFISGGFPSKTYAGLIPFSTIRMVR